MNQSMTISPSLANTRHTLGQSLIWHILPGAMTTIAFVLLRPIVTSVGFPPLFAFLVAVMFVNLPVLLGLMLLLSRKQRGRYSVAGVVSFTQKVSWQTFAVVFILTFVGVFLLTTAIMPINNYLIGTIFKGVPHWLLLEEPLQYEAYPKDILIITFSLQLIFTGIILPWVEELYFRGLLLPHLMHFRKLAPLLGGSFIAYIISGNLTDS